MKKKIKVLLTFLIVISCIGISYAIYTYRNTFNVGTLVASNIYFYVDDTTNAIGSNVLPMDRTTAALSSNNVTSFLVSGRNDTSKTLTYTIDVVNRKVNGKENIPFRFINLEIYDNNQTYYVQDISVTELKNGTLPTFTVTPNSDYTKRFYVRFWVNKNILLSDTNPKADFRLTESGSVALPLYSEAVLALDVVVTGTLN